MIANTDFAHRNGDASVALREPDRQMNREVSEIAARAVQPPASLIRLHYAASMLADELLARSVATSVVTGMNVEAPTRVLERTASGFPPGVGKSLWAALDKDLRADPYMRAMMHVVSEQLREPSQVRTFSRTTLLPQDNWREDPFVAEHVRPADIGPALASVARLPGESTYLLVFLNRPWDAPTFTDEQINAFDRLVKSMIDGIAHEFNPESPASPAARASLRQAIKERLSTAQRQVLPHLVTGMSEAAIAAKLHRSRFTVHDHARAIYRVLGVHNRAQLVRVCQPLMMNGRLEEEPCF
jgi:DNA-binding CsgD family transcriptional regulator